MNKAIFLDRDGTINENPGDGKYVLSPDGLKIPLESIEAIKIFKELGYSVIVITNQSCIGRGLLTWAELEKIHFKLWDETTIDRIRCCPHIPLTDCACRKPKPKMLLDEARQYQIDIEKSYFVGDSITDQMTAANAGCIPIKVGEEPFNTLWDFAQWLKEKER